MRSALFAAAALALPAVAHTQTDVEWLGRRYGTRPPAAYYEMLQRDPNAFRFSPDNGWILRGRAVAAERSAARSRLAQAAMTQGAPLAPEAHVVNGVLVGKLAMPVLPILYSNTTSEPVTQSQLQDILFGTTAAPPYSVTTYYEEISNGSLEVTGMVAPWRQVSQRDTYYENSNNGLTSRTADLLAEIVALNEHLDFGQFDNDGPDGQPNSGDDDGYVDAVVMMHPEVDGACRTDNIWAHKFSYRGWKGFDLTTQDPAHPNVGGNIKVRDYTIQGGQGGTNGCTAGQPPAIGLVTHETGHVLGLPDLYNTNGSRSSHGIGEWGLMGSGNWRIASSPAHMGAWSRAQLGWITEVLIPRDTTLDISPIETADTAYILPIHGTDQYYQLANRQPIGSDVYAAGAYPGGPGLLIWHVDSVLAQQRWFSNQVNAFTPEAVRLIQADNRNELQVGTNRGDPGDPWPGSEGNTAFGFATAPASNRNDGHPSYVVVSQIEQLSPGGSVRASITFRIPSLIAAVDTLARFRLDGVTRTRFDSVLTPGQNYPLEMDATQVVNNGGNRYTWLSWSNDGARSHVFTASSGGDTITANVQTEYLVHVTTDGAGSGTVSSDAGDVLSGAFVLKGETATVTASADEGAVFDGWSGDRVSNNAALTLTMNRPYWLIATFSPPLAAPGGPLPPAVMGAAYSQELSASGGTGTYLWQWTGGALPPGVALESDGTLAGRPTEAGSFTFDAQVSSGSQTRTLSFTLGVTMPVLVVDDVVRQVVGVGSALSGDDVSFLDLLGNRNGRLDVGDFLAWVEETGQQASASAAQALSAAQGEKP